MGRGLCPFPRKFCEFLYQNGELSYISGSYHLAACFTQIGSTCGIEIYWRSFQRFGNYNYSLRKIARQSDKNAQKIARKLRCFSVHFPHLLSQLRRVGGVYWALLEIGLSSRNFKGIVIRSKLKRAGKFENKWLYRGARVVI